MLLLRYSSTIFFCVALGVSNATAQILPVSIGLTSPDAEVEGHFGQSVSGAGDVNGDGFADIIVGAPNEDPGSAPDGAGRAYIYSGDGGELIYAFTSPNEQLQGAFGWSVSSAGDVNDDGFADVIVGAWNESPGMSPDSAGRAYVYSGATGATLYTLTSPNEEQGGAFGYAVSEVGDVDGDDISDLVIGAYRENPGASIKNAGRAHVYSGATGVLLYTLISPSESSDGQFGFSVSGAGDANRDGVPDLIVSGWGEEEGMSPENSGRAHVFSGVNGSLLFTLVSPNEEHGGDFGYSVSGAGDINNDGYADVIAGARNEDPGTSLLSVGRAYVFSGNGGSLLFTISAPNEEHGASVGWSVSDIGDINGDGTLDVVVGEFGNTPDLTGRAYVLSESTPLKIVGAEGWRMLTTPVVNATFDDLLGSLWTQGFPGSDYDGSSPVAAPNVYRYDETVAGDADAGFTPPVNQGEQVGSGVGFIAYVFSDDDFDGTPEGFPKRISVTGASPTGSVNLPVTYTDNGPTDQDEGWQLYGNPFAERVDSDAFVTSGFDSAVYVWDPAQAAYRVWDGSAGDLTDGVIAPFQGFFARAQSGAAAFEIPQGARTIGGAFYGRVRGETPTLALTLETTHGEARAWVRVRDTASMTYGRFDAYALGPLAPSYVQLYTRPPGTTEGTPAAGLVINALPPLTDGERYSVPLDLRIVEDGQQVQSRSTLRWPSLQAIPHNWTLELVDTETDTIVDLRKTDAYTFDWTPSPLAGESQAAHEARALLPRPMVVRGVAANRFELLITASTGVGTTTEDVGRPDVVTLSPNYPNPFSASTTLEFGLPEAGPVRLVVHDVLGRHVATLINEERRAGWHHLRLNGRALASGVYVVHLKFKDQATSIRMLVAY